MDVDKELNIEVQHPKIEIGRSKLDEICAGANYIHNEIFPSNFQCLVIGKSNSGKTNLIIELLLNRDGLKYQNVYIVSKSLHQSKYINLQKVFNLVPQIGFHCHQSVVDLPNPEECQPYSIIIFDDVCATNEANEKLRLYFTTCRHVKSSVFLLTQSIGRVPRHLIRENANFLICFKLDPLSQQLIYRDYLQGELTYEKFCQVCNLIFTKPFNFLCIDLTRGMHNGKLRSSFHQFIKIE